MESGNVDGHREPLALVHIDPNAQQDEKFRGYLRHMGTGQWLDVGKKRDTKLRKGSPGLSVVLRDKGPRDNIAFTLIPSGEILHNSTKGVLTVASTGELMVYPRDSIEGAGGDTRRVHELLCDPLAGGNSAPQLVRSVDGGVVLAHRGKPAMDENTLIQPLDTYHDDITIMPEFEFVAHDLQVTTVYFTSTCACGETLPAVALGWALFKSLWCKLCNIYACDACVHQCVSSCAHRSYTAFVQNRIRPPPPVNATRLSTGAGGVPSTTATKPPANLFDSDRNTLAGAVLTPTAAPAAATAVRATIATSAPSEIVANTKNDRRVSSYDVPLSTLDAATKMRIGDDGDVDANTVSGGPVTAASAPSRTLSITEELAAVTAAERTSASGPSATSGNGVEGAGRTSGARENGDRVTRLPSGGVSVSRNSSSSGSERSRSGGGGGGGGSGGGNTASSAPWFWPLVIAVMAACVMQLWAAINTASDTQDEVHHPDGMTSRGGGGGGGWFSRLQALIMLFQVGVVFAKFKDQIISSLGFVYVFLSGFVTSAASAVGGGSLDSEAKCDGTTEPQQCDGGSGGTDPSSQAKATKTTRATTRPVATATGSDDVTPPETVGDGMGDTTATARAAAFQANRRPVKSRGYKITHQAADLLSEAGVTPNQVSVGSVVSAVMSCLCMASSTEPHTSGHALLLLLAAMFIGGRLVCNLLDGMVAERCSGMPDPTGPVYNELPDRVSDVILLVAAGYHSNLPTLAATAAMAAVFVAYVRALGGTTKHGIQFFSGPMDKQPRMAILGAACVIEGVAVGAITPLRPLAASAWGVGLWSILIGCIITAYRRTKQINAALKGAPSERAHVLPVFETVRGKGAIAFAGLFAHGFTMPSLTLKIAHDTHDLSAAFGRGLASRVILSLCVCLLVGASVYVFVFLSPSKDRDELTKRLRSWWVIVGLFSVAMAVGTDGVLVLFACISVMAFREFVNIVFVCRGDNDDGNDDETCKAGGDQGVSRTRSATVRDASQDAGPLGRTKETRIVTTMLTGAIIIQYVLVRLRWYGLFSIFIPVFGLLATSSMFTVLGVTRGFIRKIGVLQWGLVTSTYSISYCTFLLVLPAGTNHAEGNIGMFVFLVVLTELNDVAQYISGKTFGKRFPHKIMPAVSPNKTTVGVIGGALVIGTISSLLSIHMTPFGRFEGLMIGIGLNILGFLGDVSISAVKRDLGIKDTGAVLPGHGGVLDRLDSLTFTAPVFFHYVKYVHT